MEAGIIESLPREYRSFAHEALSVSQATVLSVAETSPAAVAGIKPGDYVLTFNNETIPRSGARGWIAHFVCNNGDRPIRVLISRDGVDEIRTVSPVLVCSTPVNLTTDPVPNALATGSKIVVHSAFLRIARTDAQLALVVGHDSRMSPSETYSMEIPDSIRAGITHPVTLVRFVQLQKVVAEIADKRRRNAQLIPELKVADADTAPMTPAEDTR